VTRRLYRLMFSDDCTTNIDFQLLAILLLIDLTQH
jgi:hypothetical protein